MVSAITDQKKSVWEVNWHWEQKDIIAGSEKKKSPEFKRIEMEQRIYPFLQTIKPWKSIMWSKKKYKFLADELYRECKSKILEIKLVKTDAIRLSRTCYCLTEEYELWSFG